MSEQTAAQTRTALVELAQKWREEADGVTAMGYSQQGDRMRDCADELAAALDASPPSLPTAREVPFPKDESHWRGMANDTESIFMFTNREVRVLFTEIDRLRAALSSQEPPT